MYIRQTVQDTHRTLAYHAGLFVYVHDMLGRHDNYDLTWYKTNNAGAFDSKREKKKSTKNECTPSGTDSG